MIVKAQKPMGELSILVDVIDEAEIAIRQAQSRKAEAEAKLVEHLVDTRQYDLLKPHMTRVRALS